MQESQEMAPSRALGPPIFEGGVVRIAGREIKLGGPTPRLNKGEKLVRYTRSVCPVCYRLLPAVVFERDGKVFIRKECPEHGITEDVYWGDSELYHIKAEKWDVLGRGVPYSHIDVKAPCPFTCGLCPIHLSHTALANLVVTNRCDLTCWYCFYYAEAAGYVYEPTLEQIDFMIEQYKKQGVTMAVQITGGEPLIRDDLVEIVKLLKRKGVKHVQLNTQGIRFIKPDGAELARRLREAGVNTVYLSFDGVTPKTNPKNHWEIPFIFEAFRKARMNSVVLVPTVIRNMNAHEVGDIIKFAAMNMDIVRGVNYQPISITGLAKRSEREALRITIPEVIKLIEEQTDGQISRYAWYPVPCTLTFSRFVEALTGKKQFEMSNHPACGMATYVYVERENGVPKRFIPITDFVDIEGLFEYMNEKTEELKSGKSKYLVGTKLIFNLRKFIISEKVPKDLKIWNILYNILVRRNYDALGELHYKMLYLGMMHFMDLYNYDVARVMRCDIHYLSPDGRMIPFCAFNVLNDIYRDLIQEEYRVPLDKWVSMKGAKTIGEAIKYKRNVRELESHPLYRETYKPFLSK